MIRHANPEPSIMRFSLTLATVLLAAPTLANEDLAQQIDIVAPLLEAENYEALGGPDTHQALVESVDGRWFTLDNTVRNWEGSGAPDRERLAQSIERTCADTWENIVTHRATGPDSFEVRQESPQGEDHGSFEMKPIPDSQRGFTAEMDDAYIIEMYGLAEAGQLEQDRVLADMRARLDEGYEIWRPTPDLMINVSSLETEVWGRCPAE